MAKEPQAAKVNEAQAPSIADIFNFVVDRLTGAVGLGSRGARRGLDGSVIVDVRRIPANVLSILLWEGIEGELYTASTAAERERDKGIEDAKTPEALAEAQKYDLAANALRFMRERLAKWEAGDFGRTRGMTDPVEARAQKIAGDRFLSMVVSGKVKGIPPSAKLSTEQKAQGRDLVLAKKGDEIRSLARAQLAEEARKAKEAAQVSGDFELEM